MSLPSVKTTALNGILTKRICCSCKCKMKERNNHSNYYYIDLSHIHPSQKEKKNRKGRRGIYPLIYQPHFFIPSYCLAHSDPTPGLTAGFLFCTYSIFLFIERPEILGLIEKRLLGCSFARWMGPISERSSARLTRSLKRLSPCCLKVKPSSL